MNYDEYLYEWITPVTPDETMRVLLVGDFYMYEARGVLDALLPCTIDAVGGNTPLQERMENLRTVLNSRPYTAVVVQESRRPGAEADAACLPTLVREYPQIRFMVATGLPPYLAKARYRTKAEGLQKRNETARAVAAELGLTCFDMARQAQEAGIGSRFASWLTAVRSGVLTLCTGKKHLKGRALARHVLQDGLCRQVAEALGLGEPRPCSVLCDRDSAIAWQNRYRVPNATCLCIGDSNMFRFRLAGAFLSEHADIHSSSLHSFSEQAVREFRAALRPEHRVVVFSLGIHHLPRRRTPDFDERCRAVIAMLQENGRKVVALSTTHCAREDNLAEIDMEKNGIILWMNERFRAIATEMGCDFVDCYSIMEHEAHTDPAHFTRKGYARIAPVIEAHCRV